MKNFTSFIVYVAPRILTVDAIDPRFISGKSINSDKRKSR